MMKQVLLSDKELHLIECNPPNSLVEDFRACTRRVAKAQLNEALKRFHGTTDWVAIVEQMEKECESQG